MKEMCTGQRCDVLIYYVINYVTWHFLCLVFGRICFPQNLKIVLSLVYALHAVWTRKKSCYLSTDWSDCWSLLQVEGRRAEVLSSPACFPKSLTHLWYLNLLKCTKTTGPCDLEEICGALLAAWPQPACCTTPVQFKIVGLIIKNCKKRKEKKRLISSVGWCFPCDLSPPDSTQDTGCCCGWADKRAFPRTTVVNCLI